MKKRGELILVNSVCGVVLLGFLSALLIADAPKNSVSPQTDESSQTEVSLKTVDWDGVLEMVAKHPGKVVVVDIWTTTCPVCVEEFPHFAALEKQLGRDRLRCLSVNCDYDGIESMPPKFYSPRVLEFLTQQRAEFENVMLNVAFIDFLEEIDLGSTPAILVFGRNGRLVQRFDNDNSTSDATDFKFSDVTKLIETLLAEPI